MTQTLCGAICIGDPYGLTCVLPKGHGGIAHQDAACCTWGMTREERGEPPHPLVVAAQADDGADLLEAFSGLIGEAVTGALDSYSDMADMGSSDTGGDSSSDYSGGGESGGGGSSDDW